MKSVRIWLIVVFFLQGIVFAQSSDYQNSELRMKMQVPDGWKIAEQDKPSGDGAKLLVRLTSNKSQIVMSAQAVTESVIYRASPEDFFPGLRQQLAANVDPLDSTHMAHMSYVGGEQFADAEFRVKANAELVLILMSVVRKNVVQITLSAKSQAELDVADRMLRQNLKFEPDWEATTTQAESQELPTKVAGGISNGFLKKQVNPVYPMAAREQHIQGSVILHSVIGRNGRLNKIWIVRGDPMLTSAAVDAAKKWEYEPYRLDGKPLDVDTEITVNFQLSPGPFQKVVRRGVPLQ